MARDFRLISTDGYEALSKCAADLIASQVRANPGLLLCVASGSTPTRTYELLVEEKQREPNLFSQARFLKLDEWGGLAMDDPNTCEVYLRKRLIEPLTVSDDRYIAFRNGSNDPQAECDRIQRLLQEQGPIDLCVLGLGLNGHLAFNEPFDALEAGPHISKLSKCSLAHPMIRHTNTTTLYGLTIGMADILQSKKILLLVSGLDKREPLRWLMSGRISTCFPASFLWLHGDTTCLCDQNAACGLDVGL